MLGISRAVLLVMLGRTLCLGSEPTLSPVFRSGTEGYHTFRIPAIVRATNGVLLAFAEGRKNSASDTGDIDVVLKRSADNGSSWKPIQVVSEDGANTVGNPTPLVDSLSGKVLLLTTRNAGNVTEAQVRLGLVQDRRVFIQESADNGVTWSAPRQITAQVKRDAWRCYATGPGHGIQLTRGSHAGRLIAPCDHTTTNATDWSACGAHLVYSDDHGTTWRIGADGSPDNGWINPNECSAVELVDGKVYTLARDQEGSAAGNRAFAFSSDAGASFDAPFAIETNLVSPVVQGALLRWSAIDHGGQTNRLLFSAPADPSERRTMCIRCSFDESRTWSTAKTVYDGPSAYSDMVRMGNERLGLL
ncbi:MAG TPA: sialidase family protein, partial [Verrucomicrobiae bacterium]|nr:sialidase family protein [Verrucomicrobiae bacterium]